MANYIYDPLYDSDFDDPSINAGTVRGKMPESPTPAVLERAAIRKGKQPLRGSKPVVLESIDLDSVDPGLTGLQLVHLESGIRALDNQDSSSTTSISTQNLRKRSNPNAISLSDAPLACPFKESQTSASEQPTSVQRLELSVEPSPFQEQSMPSEPSPRSRFNRVASMPDVNLTSKRMRIPGSHGSPYSTRQKVDFYIQQQQEMRHPADSLNPVMAPSSPSPSQVFPSPSPSVFRTPGRAANLSMCWRTPGLAASPSVGQSTPGPASSPSIAQGTPGPARPRLAALSTTAAYFQSPSVLNTIQDSPWDAMYASVPLDGELGALPSTRNGRGGEGDEDGKGGKRDQSDDVAEYGGTRHCQKRQQQEWQQ
ncbi:MAG: hypothetical protein J3R72DRAFT_417475 [Linnemannia gamsii]|nr:MAG: hypothetical protein J3R72DRAFT_417475 [Linnemannia gamsii]